MKLLSYFLVLLTLLSILSCKVKRDEEQVSAPADTAVTDTVRTEQEDKAAGNSKQNPVAVKDKPAVRNAPQSSETAAVQGQKQEPYRITFLEIGSKNCIPCKMMQPIMKEIAEEYKGIVKVEFYDLMEDRQIGAKYNIRVMPTQVFLNADGKEFFRHEGFYPKDELAKMLNEQLAKLPK